MRLTAFVAYVPASTRRAFASARPSVKKASLETNRDGQKKSRKCHVLRELAAKKKHPAVVEFTAGRG